ncbi:hypothetical protein CK203_006609 [Vitis vinifera]|uniref:Uncharacterized protein n=1 Tax=Vitis vinifera TaxID=29760 RepID=A0A438KBN3_VITVI|nr:hypothetical protein CK203_006609 [Vitis vinifera]
MREELFVSSNLAGYRVYDLETHKFFSSRDVVFHEHIFPFHTNPQEEQHDVVVLPLPQTSYEPIITETTKPQADDQPPPLLSSLESTSNECTLDLNTIVSPPPPATHRSDRIKQPNVQLRNFHLYHTTKVASSQSSSLSGTCHPLTRYISYAQLSPKYRNFVCAITTFVEPTTYEQAVLDPKWQEAMVAKLHALEQNHTWTLTPLPSSHRQLGANGCIRSNITLMAQLSDTKLAAVRHWSLHQMDVQNAFLHGDLLEEVYMQLPPRFLSIGGDTYVVLIYVDDMIITDNDENVIASLKESLHNQISHQGPRSITIFL